MEKTPFIVNCKDCYEYLQEIKKFGNRKWLFRGHSNANWTLESSLYRHLKSLGPEKIEKRKWYKREKIILNIFKSLAHLYLEHLPSEKDQLSWLALMQHYGSPTRLIDFTLNPAIALFFSIRESAPQGNSFCVHALHIDTIRKNSYDLRKKLKIYQDKTPRYPKTEEFKIGEPPHSIDFIGVHRNKLMNKRQVAQDSVFVVTSKIDFDLEDWLQSLRKTHDITHFETHWVKFNFNNTNDMYYEILEQLMNIGSSPSRIFPDLGGICESLKYSWIDNIKDLDPADEL